MEKRLTVAAILERLGRKEQELKHAGAFAAADGVRTSIIALLKLADELPPEPPTLDPSE
jgi:hypothetical protein